MSSDWRSWKVEQWTAWRRRGWTLPSKKPGRTRTQLVSTVCEHDSWMPTGALAEPGEVEAWDAVQGALTGELVEERGARIRDHEAGLVYEATIAGSEGRRWLTGLTILVTDPDQRIDRELLRRVPVGQIAEQVALQLAAEDAVVPRPPTFTEDGREVMRIEAPVTALGRRPRGVRPTDDELIADVRGGNGRQQIARKYHVSPSTVDNWLGPLRDRGAIPRQKAGRPAQRKEGDA